MKKTWIIISLIIFGFGLNAQVDADLVIGKNYQVENVSSLDLKLKSYQWFTQFFKSSGNELISIEVGDNSIKGKTKLFFAGEEVVFDFETVFKEANAELSFKNISNRKSEVVQFLNNLQERFNAILHSEITADTKSMILEQIESIK